jgi:excisionase family DNA binding protein
VCEAEKSMNQVYTIAEVATHLKVSTRTVREWLRSGKLKGLKAGRLWRIREEELRAYLERLRPPDSEVRE